MKFRFAVFAAASALGFNAQADTFNWGVHDPLEVGVSHTAVGSFEDSYLFAFTKLMALFTTGVANNQLPVLAIDNGMVTLFQKAGPVDISIGSFAFDGTTGNATHAFSHTISSTFTPVSEPETYALMLAGLSIVGFVALRRRSGAASR